MASKTRGRDMPVRFTETETLGDRRVTLTSSQPAYLDGSNFITLSATTTVVTIGAAEYSGVNVWLVDRNTAQNLLNNGLRGQFSGYEMTQSGSGSYVHSINVPAGQWFVYHFYNGGLGSSQTASAYGDASFVTATGGSFVGSFAMAVNGAAGSWKAQSFTVTGAPDLYVKAEAGAGNFAILTSQQYQTFLSNPSSYVAGTPPHVTFAGFGAPSTNLEGQFRPSAGTYVLLWYNGSGGWDGGGAYVTAYAETSGSTFTSGGGQTPGGGTGGGGTGGLSPAALKVQLSCSGVLRWSGSAFALSLVEQVNSGSLSQNAAYAQIVKEAGATTSVATMSYQFFTGKAPTAAGMDYLVSPTGPNANNLNSAYYQSFSLENRYINFAVNLGKNGEGLAGFTAGYGSLTFYDAFKKAYGVIFGDVTDTRVRAILDAPLTLNGAPTTRQQYFAAYGGDGLNGIGTKAAAVGWLMSEAEKADLGTYAKSNDAFLLDVAANGATFGVDLIGRYAQPSYVYHPGG